LEGRSGDVLARLLRLNNAQHGSFGKYLFGLVASESWRGKVKITRRHGAVAMIDGSQLDEKTTIRDIGCSEITAAMSGT
jgi:hypothetical protein